MLNDSVDILVMADGAECWLTMDSINEGSGLCLVLAVWTLLVLSSWRLAVGRPAVHELNTDGSLEAEPVVSGIAVRSAGLWCCYCVWPRILWGSQSCEVVTLMIVCCSVLPFFAYTHTHITVFWCFWEGDIYEHVVTKGCWNIACHVFSFGQRKGSEQQLLTIIYI